tara:strand:+ start:140 stop:589 length:450 start_codon:yes stop_codon:yes gene_type:complete
MKTKQRLTTKQLTSQIIKIAKSGSATISVFTGEDAKPNYWAIGGMVRPYGELNALYYSPSGTPDADRLQAHIDANWEMIQLVGYVGIWRNDDGETFIDSTYLIPCGCDTEVGFSEPSFQTAYQLAVSNRQDSICHTCETLETPNCFGVN